MYFIRIRTDSIIYEVKTIRPLSFPPSFPSPRVRGLLLRYWRMSGLAYGWTPVGPAHGGR